MKEKSTISLYWKCQFLGWSAAALYWAYAGFTGTGFSWLLAVIHFIADLFIYISLSHLYRNFSLQQGWQRLSIQKLMIRIIPVIAILGFAFMVVTIGKNYLVRLWLEPGFSEPFKDSFSSFWLTTFVTGVRLMAIWVLAYYGYHFTRREIDAVKESTRLALVAKDAAFNNLSAQLNPHFFFNSLNSIKALVIENPQSARRAIDLLSELLRTSLYDRSNTMIPLKDELALVRDYLELEQIRFEKRLQATFETDDRLAAILVLPLSIQVLVENGIKHGIAQQKEGGMISIKVEEQEEFLQVSVRNPGTLDSAGTHGLGLKNLRERLQLQFNGKAAFQLIQEMPGTILASIKLPMVWKS